MLARPAASMAQQGSSPNWALAGQGAVSTSTTARSAERSLLPSNQVFVILRASEILFMAFLSFCLIGAAAN